MLNLLLIFHFSAFTICCQSKVGHNESLIDKLNNKITTGAEQMQKYLPEIRGKKVAVLVNHTSLVNSTHLVDTLISSNVHLTKIFAPEHGFRGDVSDGLEIDHTIDSNTGLPIISLYGKNKKPTKKQLSDVDVVIFDIQDVGARFYTYISAMHYMMEACANNNIKMIILDRPNPNGHYVDGPVLEMDLKSYVGMHQIPIVYGMTIGELAQMIVGEKWLESTNTLDLSIIPLQNWNHQTIYPLPIKPSPNLPNDQSIALYPSLCLFEGTQVSVGRGTYDPFQIIGLPDSTFGDFNFTPVSISNMSKYPPYENQQCFGLDLRNVLVKAEINLTYLIEAYKKSNSKNEFFNPYFKKLAGTESLIKQIKSGLNSEEIKNSWQDDLVNFKLKRAKYLIYKDF